MSDVSQSTVRVRILVAVDRNGKWSAAGRSGTPSDETKEWLYIDDLEDGEVYHWIEADVPLPAEAGAPIEGIVHAAK